MKGTSSIYGGVLAKIYILNKGEAVPPGRHKHTYTHTTVVLAGCACVYVFDGRPSFRMGFGMPHEKLPANIDHEIIAVEDGTIVMNMTALCDLPKIDDHAYELPPACGGVLSDDGTVVR